MSTEPSMDLSIIIPAYNEENRLKDTLNKVRAYIDKLPIEAEVIVVDDGSSDQTAHLVCDSQREWPILKLMRSDHNHGKGHAVKQGAMAAVGKRILFTDADLSTPIEDLEKLEEYLNDGSEVAIASRDLEDSDVVQHQPWYRETMGKIFNKLVRLLTGLPFKDTQCGFKLFTRNAVQKIFPKMRIWRFAFDVEILWLAKKRGLTVSEVPVRWVNHPASRVNPLKDSSRMLWDVIRIRRNDLKGRYDD